MSAATGGKVKNCRFPGSTGRAAGGDMAPSVMENPSPYLPPASPPPPLPGGSVPEPSAVKVFGILHLILAGLGLLFGIWSLFAKQTNTLFMNPGTPGYEAQLRYMDEVLWVSVMTGVFLLVLAGMLLVAGLKLVRSRPDGVAWSHRYAWTSIATKMISLVIAVAVLLPAIQRMTGEMMPPPSNMPPGSAETMTRMMNVFISVGTTAGPIISCLYPALALYFLSRPRVKEWVERSR
jgi:hypothetical protein